MAMKMSILYLVEVTALVFFAFCCPAWAQSQYDDSFDTLRQGIWETSLYVHKDHHVENFAVADVECIDGRLVMSTRKRKSSKGTIRSLFKLEGDFDVQMDMKIDFDVQSRTPQHAMFWLTAGKDNDLVVLMYKPGDKQSAILMFLQDAKGKDTIFKRQQFASFDGTVRAVRSGIKTTCFLRAKGTQEWTKLGTAKSFSGAVQVGVNLRNYHRHTNQEESATESVVLYVDNFRINSADSVIESDI